MPVSTHRRPVRLFLAAAVLLVLAWTGAWLVERALAARFPALEGSGPSFAWWTLCKLALWIAPALLLTWSLQAEVWGREPLRGLAVGAVASLLWCCGSWVIGRLAGSPATRPRVSWALANLYVVAPLFEELVFRGAARAWLRAHGVGRWHTIGLTAFAFALLHVPGWLMMGQPVLGPVPRVFVFGLAAGLVRDYGRSLVGPIVLHAANNAWSSRVWLLWW